MIANESYINRHTIQGMMSKPATPFPTWDGFRKNKKNVVLFQPLDDYSQFENDKVAMYYLLQEQYDHFLSQNIKHTKSKGNLLLSNIDNGFISLYGDKYHEFREAKNKYNKIIEIRTTSSLDDIKNLIEVWKTQRAKLYGWHCHAGYDIAFFNKYWDLEKSSLFSNFFYIDNRLVGYSIVSKLNNSNYYNYVIRKNDTTYRNLCLYIDYKTFEIMNDEIKSPFIINWGSSSGGVRDYKRKFPIYDEPLVYFTKFRKEL